MTICTQCGSTLNSTEAGPLRRCERCRRAAAATRPRTPTPAPAHAEESGIIDVRALAAVLADEHALPRPMQPLLGLGPVTLTRRPPPGRPSAPARSGARPILGAVAFGLAFALVGLTGYALARQPAAEGEARASIPAEDPAPPIVARRAAAPDPTPSESEDEADLEAPTDEADLEAPTTESTESAAPEGKPSRAARRRTPRATDEATKAPKALTTAPTKEPTAAPTPVKEGPDQTSVGCLLDPEKCREKPAAPIVREVPSAGPSLPATLAASEITQGTREAKKAALSACRALAKPGESVQIKLSIAGPSGSVLSTTVVDAGERPELAPCCARELAKSTFPKVQKEQIGAVVTVRF
ncbi:MAG: hypothetical protein R3B09_27155 [Nannocystaceae bacterium]